MKWPCTHVDDFLACGTEDFELNVIGAIKEAFQVHQNMNPVEEHFIKFNVSLHIHKSYILITKVQKFPYWDLGIQ